MATRTPYSADGDSQGRGPRTAVLVGPYTAGKTTLFEALLHMSGAIPRKGAVAAGTSVGDGDFGPEARARQTTIEPNLAHTDYLGESWTLIDTPGSVELTQDALACAMIADIVILVVEADPDRAVSLAPWLRFLDAKRIPHAIFVNKMDKITHRLRDVLDCVPIGGAEKTGAARSADPRRRSGRRLCRPGERARVPLPPQPEIRLGRTAGLGAAARTRSTPGTARSDRRLRRFHPRTTARRSRTGSGRDLRAAGQGRGRGNLGAGVLRIGREFQRRAPFVESAAPRNARHVACRGASGCAGLCRVQRHRVQDFAPAAYGQAFAGAAVARQGKRRHGDRRPSSGRSLPYVRQRAAKDERGRCRRRHRVGAARRTVDRTTGRARRQRRRH